jgi:hypothetical protein
VLETTQRICTVLTENFEMTGKEYKVVTLICRLLTYLDLQFLIRWCLHRKQRSRLLRVQKIGFLN